MSLWLYILIGYFVLTHLLILALRFLPSAKIEKLFFLFFLITAPLCAITFGIYKLIRIRRKKKLEHQYSEIQKG